MVIDSLVLIQGIIPDIDDLELHELTGNSSPDNAGFQEFVIELREDRHDLDGDHVLLTGLIGFRSKRRKENGLFCFIDFLDEKTFLERDKDISDKEIISLRHLDDIRDLAENFVLVGKNVHPD